MKKKRVLDLFCGAGGASMGLHNAGFEVEGVDINKQPHYPFKFHHADALSFPLAGYDLIWASPPCQAYTKMQMLRKNGGTHKDLIDVVRKRLKKTPALWVIENVEGSPLRKDLMLCGTMFGLRLIKHRYFEANFSLRAAPQVCDHRDVYDPWHGQGRSAEKMREAQGTPWIPSSGGASRKRGETGDLNNAIPPAYSEYIGRLARRIF